MANEYSNEQFAAKLRGRMAELKVTREALAEQTGIAKDTIHRYTNGIQTPGADKVYLIAEALGTTPNELMGWNKEPAA